MTGFWSPLGTVFTTLSTSMFGSVLEAAPAWLRKYLVLSEKPVTLEVSSPDEVDFAQARAASDVDILLHEKLFLVHEMEIPAEAKSEVSRVVAMEAERVMPLRTSCLHIAYSVSEGTKKGPLKATIIAVRRSMVSALLRKAVRHNIQIRSIAAPVGDQAISLNVPELNQRRYKKAISVCMAFIMFFTIIGMAPSFYFDQLVEEVTATDAAIRVVKKNTSQIAGLQKQVQTLQQLSTTVQSAKENHRILSLFAELTEASPDSVVIDEFRMDGSRLYISGRASAPEEWVIQLQQNSMFDAVRLTSVLGQQDGSRRFEIHMQIVWTEEVNL